jgi:site-specific recombinase XerC
MARALRTFLRYLYSQGEMTTDLAACIPRVANWQLSTLPRFLEPDQVDRVLKRCSRNTGLGKRNYAILLSLSRLGLRACEIVSFETAGHRLGSRGDHHTRETLGTSQAPVDAGRGRGDRRLPQRGAASLFQPECFRPASKACSWIGQFQYCFVDRKLR